MAARSRQRPMRRSPRLGLAEARSLARANPDALAHSLLRPGVHLNARQSRAETWHLLQELGSDAVLRRAGSTLRRTRSAPELRAILSAAVADQWTELAPDVAWRFDREVTRLAARRPSAECIQKVEALADAALALKAQLADESVRELVQHSAPALRTLGARLVFHQEKESLVDAVLPLCWQRGAAGRWAAAAVGLLGRDSHAALLWTRALAARRARHGTALLRALRILGQMGAFDILVALRVWVAEDFARDAALGWRHAEAWSQLIAARLAAGEGGPSDALADLRHFASHPVPASLRLGGPDEDWGPYHLARQLIALGAIDDARHLVERVAECGAPPAGLFPDLQAYVPGAPSAPPPPPFSGPEFVRALSEGALPDDWAWRTATEPAEIEPLLQDALTGPEPGRVRHLLGQLSCAWVERLRPEIEALASHHSSAVVRWKAARVLNCAPMAAEVERPSRARRWLRLDAAILSGALRPGDLGKSPAEPAHPAGLQAPTRPGQGWRLKLDGLSQADRTATLTALLKVSLTQALDRRQPQGPSYEDRPDVRALREPAPPRTAADERMAEMARAVMEFWNDADEPLTLDEEGLGTIAASLGADGGTLDPEDVDACGAFIGEVLRRRLGGQWTGFDENYLLEVGDELLDPLGWAREIHAQKDMVDAARVLAERYQDALRRMRPKAAQRIYPDPGKAFGEAAQTLSLQPLKTPMTELLREARVLAIRLQPGDWLPVMDAMDDLLTQPAGVRAVAAMSIYCPGDIFGRAWARWGQRRRESTGLIKALLEAMEAAAELDDLEAMPNWTMQFPQSRLSFLNPLRKRMAPEAWRRVLPLLLRQRAAAGDRSGVGWCLYSYKYEFPDPLELIALFCELPVSSRQTVLRATTHCTRDELKLFRPLWAEGLRDPSPPVVLAALEAAGFNRARSLRHLVDAIAARSDTPLASAAQALLKMWDA